MRKILILIYVVFLIISVSEVESKVGFLGYEHLKYGVEINIKILLSILIVNIVGSIMPRNLLYPTDSAAWILFVIWYIPVISLSALFISTSDDIIKWLIKILILTVMMVIFALLGKIKFIKKEKIIIKINEKKEDKNLKKKLMYIGILSVIYLIFLAFRFESKIETTNLLIDIYERRLSARENFAENVISGYLVGWIIYSISPMLVWYSYERKSKLYFILAILIGVIIFIIDGTKSSLLIAIYCLMTLKYVKSYKNEPHKILYIPIFIIIGSIIMWNNYDSPIISGFFVRRLLTDTALTFWAYDNIFSENLFWFRDSMIASIFNLDRLEDKSIHLALLLNGGENENWNGSSYAEILGDIGWIGIPIIAFLQGIVFKILNKYSENEKIKGLVETYGCLFIYFWSQSAFLTSFLTYGVVTSTIIIIIFNNISNDKKLNLKLYEKI